MAGGKVLTVNIGYTTLSGMTAERPYLPYNVDETVYLMEFMNYFFVGLKYESM